jgi:hypothetical protein
MLFIFIPVSALLYPIVLARQLLVRMGSGGIQAVISFRLISSRSGYIFTADSVLLYQTVSALRRFTISMPHGTEQTFSLFVPRVNITKDMFINIAGSALLIPLALPPIRGALVLIGTEQTFSAQKTQFISIYSNIAGLAVRSVTVSAVQVLLRSAYLGTGRIF